MGGHHDGALVVRVAEPAEGGRATDAALRAVAEALALPRRSVTLLRGASSHRKLIDIEVKAPRAALLDAAVARLRGQAEQ